MGLRAFLSELIGSGQEFHLPQSVLFTLPDGRETHVSTEAVSSTSANFKTHKIVMPLPDRIEVKQTFGAKVFFGVFAIMGTAALLFFLPMPFREVREDPMAWIGVGICFLVGSIFVVVGVAGILGFLGGPMTVMDRRVGLYWKGRPPKAIRAWAQPPLALEQIAAVQICSKRVSDPDGSYTAYEINLVLADPAGERIHLMSHGKKTAILHDTQLVAEFLDRPILDHG